MRLLVCLLLALVAILATPVTPAQASDSGADAQTAGACAAARVATTTLPRAEDEAIPIEGDWDCDEVANELDNCPQTKNGDQSDVDGDGIGDRCDPNADNDDFPNTTDNCPLVVNNDQNPNVCLVDTDRDGVMDPSDNCRLVVNPEQTDTDRDSYGDACDADDDDDYHLDGGDNCPLVPNPGPAGLADADRDGLGDACDPDTSILTPVTPGPGTGTGRGTDPASLADRRAPTVGVRAARLQRSTDASGGMPVLVRCSEACAVSARLVVSARDARRLKLARSARKPVMVASGEAALEASGSTYVFFAMTRAARRRVFTSKAVAANLEVRAIDGAGNATVVRRALALRR